MPHELPAVVCGLLQGCSEISLEALVQAARTASHSSLGARWKTREECPSQTPVGASLQAAHKDLLRVDFEVVEGIIAGLQFHQAGSAAYVTLERCIRFGKTVGCKGCDRIAEGVRHSDECHARIGKLLEDERLAKESDSKKDKEKSEAAVGISMHTLKDKCSSQKVKENPIVLPEGHESKLQASHVDCCNAEALNDYWDFDEAKAAWKRIHVRPRKRLFTPLGNDCPFDSFEVTTERQTVWTCRNKTSLFADDWQSMSPNRRICSRSWVGCTYFFPKEKPENVKARIMTMTSIYREGTCSRT